MFSGFESSKENITGTLLDPIVGEREEEEEEEVPGEEVEAAAFLRPGEALVGDAVSPVRIVVVSTSTAPSPDDANLSDISFPSKN